MELYDLLFADQDLDELVLETELDPDGPLYAARARLWEGQFLDAATLAAGKGEPWSSFIVSLARIRGGLSALRTLIYVAEKPDFETRVHLWAWNALRKSGYSPSALQATDVLGLVVEAIVDGGRDALAAYQDGGIRFLGHADNVVIREPDDDTKPLVDDALSKAYAPHGHSAHATKEDAGARYARANDGALGVGATHGRSPVGRGRADGEVRRAVRRGGEAAREDDGGGVMKTFVRGGPLAMRSAPAPDQLPIPGMNQGTAVAAGDGGAGGGDGDGGDGNDKEGAGGGNGGDDATGDNRNAPDKEKYPTCGTESHPVDVVTGQVFTHPIVDLSLPGPLPFSFERSYSSTASRQDQGLGFGWAHSLWWFVEVMRNRVRVWNEKGVSVSFPIPQIGHSILGDWGWVVRRELWGFAVDANDDVWRIFSTSFDEGKSFRLTAIEDRNKNRIALTYDDGKLVEIKDSAGRTIKVTSTKQGRIASIEVKNSENHGQWIAFGRYQYDDLGRLVRVTDADDYSWTYEYDQYNRLVRDTDRVGLSFCFRYDEKDRGIEAWGEYAGRKDPSLADDLPMFLADGKTRAKGIYHRKFDYHPRGYTEVTDTTETRRYFGNKKGLLDKAVAGGAVSSSKYDDRGFEIEKTDPIGAITTWVRNERGRVLQVVDPLGRTTQIERDGHGLAVRMLDATNAATRIDRDQRGNIVAIYDAAGGSVSFSRDDRGLIASVTNPLGATTNYTHDTQGNLVRITHPNGAAWLFTFDGFGRTLATTDPENAQVRNTYTSRGDLVATQNPAGNVTRYSRDGEGHLIQLTTPTGHSTRVLWGGFHKLCERIDAMGATVRLLYSREGELTKIVNENGEAHRIFYDTSGLKNKEITFDEQSLNYRCRSDVKGLLALRVRRGRSQKLSTTLQVKSSNASFPTELQKHSNTTHSAESLKRQTRQADSNGLRDVLGKILRESQSVDGIEYWVDSTYDRAGNRVARQTSLGHSETVGRDAMGARVLTTLDGATHIRHSRDLVTREIGRALPGGAVIESAFDSVGRLERRVVRSLSRTPAVGVDEPEWVGARADSITFGSLYTYDADGELIVASDVSHGTSRFEYDAIGRLAAAIRDEGPTETFRSDPAGNIYETVPGAPDRTYAPGNRLLRRGTVNYLWDEDGRLREKREESATGSRVWRYSWDGAGLLSSVEMPTGERASFAYDPYARRIRKPPHGETGPNGGQGVRLPIFGTGTLSHMKS